MIYKTIGRDRVSAVALGSGNFGSKITEKEALYVMDAYRDAGGNVIDTGRIYCGDRSETAIGEFMQSRGARGDIFLVTKGGHPELPSWRRRISRREVTEDLETSLRFLRTDVIDLYFLHRDDESLPVSEIMPFLDGFVKAGKVRYLGASNWSAARIEEANAFARANGMTEFACSQILWNYTKVNQTALPDQTLRVMDATEYAHYEKNGIPVMAYTSQAQGFFAFYKDGRVPDALMRDYMNETTKARAERVIALADAHGVSPSAVALAALLHDRVCAIPVIGASSPERVKESLAALTLERTALSALETG